MNISKEVLGYYLSLSISRTTPIRKAVLSMKDDKAEFVAKKVRETIVYKEARFHDKIDVIKGLRELTRDHNILGLRECKDWADKYIHLFKE